MLAIHFGALLHAFSNAMVSTCISLYSHEAESLKKNNDLQDHEKTTLMHSVTSDVVVIFIDEGLRQHTLHTNDLGILSIRKLCTQGALHVQRTFSQGRSG